jgi:hypothetical protein
MITYRNMAIEATYPSGYGFGFESDERFIGTGKTIDECKEAIDRYYFENTHYRVFTSKTITKFLSISDAVRFAQMVNGVIQPMFKKETLEFDSI